MDTNTQPESRAAAKAEAERNENWSMTDDPYYNGWDRGFDVGYDAGLAARPPRDEDGWVSIAENGLPPAKEGFQHTEQFLVRYPPEGGAFSEQKFGLAYYHYDSPYKGSGWIDWQDLGREPTHYQKIEPPKENT